MPSIPALPEVERLVGDLADEVAKAKPSAKALWHIWGPATAGKSTALGLLGARLRERGLVPILIAPPARTLDAGPLALVEAATGLARGALIDGQLESIRSEKVTWSEKLASVAEWTQGAGDRVVLLCDEPGAWPSAASEDVYFASHAREAAVALVGTLTCRRVVAGDLPAGVTPAHRTPLGTASDPAAWLRDARAWGSLAPAALELLDRIGEDLRRRSPLEIRLLVALVALRTVDDVARWWATQPGRRDISRRLAATVEQEGRRQGPFLKEAWARLSLVRRPIADDLLGQIAGPAPDATGEALLRNCLLYSDSDGHILHWSLRLDAREHAWWDDARERAVHRALAEYYTGRFRRRSGTADPGALLDELEAYHHATLSGDASLLDGLRPYFADQLDALGRTLSRDFKRYDEAARVFERACAWEPQDDYAHHYLAFNLDILAERPDNVETHYQEAIKIAPGHAWWHSRWITYLVTRGRMDEAHRAWNEALDALGLPDPNADPWIYENLHLWVARLLVHRGRLDFANDVLRDISPIVRQWQPGIAAIARRLEALLEARRARAVFPLNIPPDRWWSGPHLCPQRRSSGAELVRWMAGRVDALDEKEVHLHVAEPPAAAGGSPSYGFLSIPVADFDRWTRDERAGELAAGQFVELAWYGNEAEAPMIRVHRELTWEDPDLPPLFPDPTRYLRKAGWVKEGP